MLVMSMVMVERLGVRVRVVEVGDFEMS